MSLPLERGAVIAGKYRVERVLGQGGMGVVLAARHLGLDEMVALKLIRQEPSSGTGGEDASTRERADARAEALSRFQREARAAARIKSEHVARVLDVDRLPEGQPYIVMELIDGTDLHAHVQRRGRLPAAEAALYVTQACEGLAEAHALGMVHRDLKLKNLFLTRRRDGRPLIKVIDFGVVKIAPLDDTDVTVRGRVGDASWGPGADTTLTSTTAFVGSVHYMAPEQIRASSVVTAQADVWSLGVCLYAMLTGALPFDGATADEVCARIQGLAPRDVREHVPEVPSDLAAAVAHALEKDLGRRFANVAELARALAPHGLDPAAALRIETILSTSGARSGPDPGAALAPALLGSGATALDSGALATVSIPEGGAQQRLGRAASTVDAVGLGRAASTVDAVVDVEMAAARSVVGSAPPAPRRRRWALGAAVALVATGASVVLWVPGVRRPPAGAQETPARAEPPAPGSRPVAATSSALRADRSGDDAGNEAPSVASAVLAPSRTAPVAPAPTPTDGATTTKRPARTPRAASSRPKTEPAPPRPESAYDHF